jgi:hypothetical protein
VESEVRASLFAADAPFLVENTRTAVERYLGWALIFLGVWYVRQSIDSHDNQPSEPEKLRTAHLGSQSEVRLTVVYPIG